MTSCKPSFVFHNRNTQYQGEFYPSSKGIELLPFQSIMLQQAAQISCKLKAMLLQEMILCNWSKADTSPYKEISGDKSFTGLSSLSQPAGYLKK